MEFRIEEDQQKMIENTTNKNLHVNHNGRAVVISVPGFKVTYHRSYKFCTDIGYGA